jgi:hypothetical protein
MGDELDPGEECCVEEGRRDLADAAADRVDERVAGDLRCRNVTLGVVRSPSTLFIENVAPGRRMVPSITSDARWMFTTRGWPDG